MATKGRGHQQQAKWAPAEAVSEKDGAERDKASGGKTAAGDANDDINDMEKLLPHDVHTIGRTKGTARTRIAGDDGIVARSFTSVVSSPTANFLLAGAVAEPGLYLLQNESYKEDNLAPLRTDDVTILDESTPVYDLAWQNGIVLGASTSGAVRMWTIDASNRVQATTTFFHSVRKIGGATGAPPPGTMYNDRRVLKVHLHGKDFQRALTLDSDSLAMWNITRTDSALAIEKAPGNISFACVDTSTCAPNTVAVGTSNGSVLLLDSVAGGPSSTARLTLKAPTQGEGRPVRAVAFNPFSPHWVAAAGMDATVRIWDMRYTTKPMRELYGHTTAVTSLAWSPCHSEWITSGSLDQSWRLWTLGAQPPDIIASVEGQVGLCTHGLSSGVRAVTFCDKTPTLAVALSTTGNITTVRCSPAFESGLTLHRYHEETAKDEHAVEEAVYRRDMAEASRRALAVINSGKINERPQLVLELLRLCVPLPPNRSPGGVGDQPMTPRFLTEARVFPASETPDQQAMRRFESELFELAYYVPGDMSYRTSESDDTILNQMILQQRSHSVREAIASGRKQEVLGHLSGILKDLSLNLKAYDISLLQDVFEIAKTDNLPRALRFGFDVVHEFKRQQAYPTAISLVHALLFPTVFDIAEDQDPISPKLTLGTMISLKYLSTACAGVPSRTMWQGKKAISSGAPRPSPAPSTTSKAPGGSSGTTSQTLAVPSMSASGQLKAAKPKTSTEKFEDTSKLQAEVLERLTTELSNPDVVLPMVQTLIDVNNFSDEIDQPTDEELEQLVTLMSGKINFNTMINRLYFSALVRLERFEDYYREASRVAKAFGACTFTRQLQLHSAQGAFSAVKVYFEAILEGTSDSDELLEETTLKAAHMMFAPDNCLPPDVLAYVQEAFRFAGSRFAKMLARAPEDKSVIAQRAKAMSDTLLQLKKSTAASMTAVTDLQHVLDRLAKITS